MFNPVDTKTDFAAMERDILDWWERNDIPAKYMARNAGADKTHSFIDGPITANNPMGVHHAWGRSYKDIFLRFRAMQGYDQRYQNGFDGQGLWIEVEVEKELGFGSKRDIEAFGVGKFVDMCKQRVDHFADIISRQSIRLGYWMDWDDSYHTKSDENNYTIWHFLKACHAKGWLYEGRDVMPWCPRCGTGLSEHEIVTEGYKEIVHPGLFVKFPLMNVPSPSMGEGQDGGDESKESLLVWTTTPWTLTANAAAAVHPEKTYIKVRQDGETLYLIKERADVLKGDYELLGEVPSSALIGLRYRAPFAELTAQDGVEHRVVAWDEVSESEGTGIVHIAPGAGKEDFALGGEHDIPAIAPLDEYGDFVEGFDWLTGMNVYDVNEPIYDSLKSKGMFYNLERYSHRYPVCWRCDSELVFRLVDEWFISMGEKHEKPREELTAGEKANSLRYQIMDVVDDIRWVPEFGYARELDWLRNMDDWMISKKRYYGLALPIYKCDIGDCGWFDVIGSETELQARAVEGWAEFEGNSPHRPWVDSVKISCDECGATVSRIEDVGNAWLDAGIVSFSTLQYRHDQDYWRKWFPADWISESFPGQFRNWFYSLLTMSTVLENTAPFKSVFSYALMRDDQGEEMHKSKGNAIWFEDAAERMGVDAMRWVFLRQNPALNINFGFRSADEVRRRFIIPLWNVYSFFVTYANIDRYDATATPPPVSERAELDRWILSELNQLVKEVTDAFENFDPDRAARHVEGFVEYLSNWYVRRSRRRFWKAGILAENADADKHGAYATLYDCLLTLIKLVAPVMPFMTEQMYQNLVRQSGISGQASGVNGSTGSPRTGSNGRESIHLDDFPVADETLIDESLSRATRMIMQLSSMGRAARQKAGIKVRQPVQTMKVLVGGESDKATVETLADQLREELNVKDVEVIYDGEGMGDIHFWDWKVSPNMRVLGPKYGPRLREISEWLAEADAREVVTKLRRHEQIIIPSKDENLPPIELARGLPKGGGWAALPSDTAYLMADDEPAVNGILNILTERVAPEGFAAEEDRAYSVALSTEITPELRLEGDARELVHGIQNMRRSADFDIADHIVTYYDGGAELDAVIAAHGDYIRQETLSQELVNAQPVDGAYTETLKVNDMQATVGVRRAE